jgi:NitT/TauT family transport system ATP-binding protein
MRRAPDPAASAALEVIGLRERYVKDGRPIEVLDLDHLAVRDGEFVTIVGPSGCGKTTLLHMLGGFIKADAGRIRVHGREVVAPGPDRGMVFQEFALFPWRTVAGNVAWGLEVQAVPVAEREAIVQRHLELTNLVEFRNHLPGELSGGMKQRVALARVLAFDPKVLLMDEPFGSLDAQTRETMQDELMRIWERTGKTIAFVTHDIEEAVYLADRVVVLTARPARVHEEIVVDLPRPRDRAVRQSVACLEYRNYVSDLIRGETARAGRSPERPTVGGSSGPPAPPRPRASPASGGSRA